MRFGILMIRDDIAERFAVIDHIVPRDRNIRGRRQTLHVDRGRQPGTVIAGPDGGLLVIGHPGDDVGGRVEFGRVDHGASRDTPASLGASVIVTDRHPGLFVLHTQDRAAQAELSLSEALGELLHQVPVARGPRQRVGGVFLLDPAVIVTASEVMDTGPGGNGVHLAAVVVPAGIVDRPIEPRGVPAFGAHVLLHRYPVESAHASIRSAVPEWQRERTTPVAPLVECPGEHIVFEFEEGFTLTRGGSLEQIPFGPFAIDEQMLLRPSEEVFLPDLRAPAIIVALDDSEVFEHLLHAVGFGGRNVEVVGRPLEFGVGRLTVR